MPVAERRRRPAAAGEGADIPTLYVNDNFGRWQSDLRAVLDHCLTTTSEAARWSS